MCRVYASKCIYTCAYTYTSSFAHENTCTWAANIQLNAYKYTCAHAHILSRINWTAYMCRRYARMHTYPGTHACPISQNKNVITQCTCAANMQINAYVLVHTHVHQATSQVNWGTCTANMQMNAYIYACTCTCCIAKRLYSNCIGVQVPRICKNAYVHTHTLVP